MSTLNRFGALLFSLLMVTSVMVAGIAVTATGPALADEEEDALTPGEVNSTGTIEQPGEYVLTEDIDLGGDNVTAFEIKTGDVVLDGGGHTISNGASEAIHILAQPSLSNVTIKNLEITGVETGISSMNLQDGSFENLDLVDNNDAGIVFAGAQNTNNVVTDATFRRNEKGVFLRQGTSGMTIRDSTFDTNHEVAIKLSGSRANEILDSDFIGQDGEKTIHVTGRSPDNVIVGNHIADSSGPEYAVQIGGESANTTIEDNVVADNGLGGISLGPPDNVVRNNTITGNGDPGLLMESGGNVVAENTIADNRIGISIAGASGIEGTDNVVRNNEIRDVLAAEGATGNVLANTVVDDAGTTVTVEAAAVDFGLSGVDTVPSPPAPEGYDAVGTYVDTAPTSDTGTAALRLHYDENDVSGPEEDVTAATFDGGEWEGLPGVTVDTAADYVAATVSTETTVGVVAGTGDIIDPVADAGSDRTVLANETVTFDAGASTDDQGIETYEWDFDDGTNATGESVEHTFDAAGTYTVALTVTDAAGNTDTDTVAVEVLGDDGTDPVADAGDDHYVLIGSEVAFDGTGSTDNIGVVSYEWDFDDGTNATGATASHTYAAPGDYDVTLTVADAAGNTNTDVANVTVIESDTQDPEAEAGADRTVEVGTAVTFDGGASTDDIGIDSYAWDFGDGATASGEVVEHAFDAEGTYTVSLTVEDGAGNTDTDSATIEVAEHVDEETLEPGPISSFGVIEQPGTYTLQTDLSAVEEGVTTGFEVKVGDVTIDGNGHTVSGGPAAAEGVHVLGTTATLENVTVEDLRLTEWDSAISAKKVQNSSFLDIEFVSNMDKGLAISGEGSADNLVEGNRFEDNEKGVFLEQGITRTTIEDNDFVNNHEVGVKASGASETDLLDSYFTGHDGEKAIHFTGRSPGTSVVGNVLEDNGYVDDLGDAVGPEYVIQLGGESGDSLIADNVLTDNVLGGISAGPLDVEVRNNTVTGHGDPGILVGDGGAPVTENTVTDNRVGVAFEGSSDVTATDNAVRNNTDWDVQSLDNGTADVTGLTVDGAGTVLAIGASGTDYQLAGGAAIPAPLPGDWTAVGEALEANFTSPVGTLPLTTTYDDADLSNDAEDRIVLLRYEAATGQWLAVTGSTPDTRADTVAATVEAPGVLVPATGTSDLEPPEAVATANVSVAAVNDTIAFDAGASTDNEGIESYAWDFGDGTTATGETVTHAYADAGTYTVTLTVTDAANYSSSTTLEVDIDGAAPVAEAGEDLYVLPGESFTLNGSASTDDVGIASYEWAVGDNTTLTGETVTHSYADAGRYPVTLTVTDHVTNTDTDEMTVTVDDQEPQPDPGQSNRNGQAGQSLTFDGSASTDDVGIVSYEWDFDDGTTASGDVVTHSFDADGEYDVTLTVADAAGNEATATVDVTIETATTQPPDDGTDDTDDTDGTTGGGGGAAPAGGGGGGGGAAPTAPADAGPSVDLSYEGATARVGIQNAGADDRVQLRFEFQASGTDHRLDGLNLRVHSQGTYRLRVGQPAEAPGGTPAWQSAGDGPAIGYFDLAHDHGDAFERAQFEFRVHERALAEHGVGPGDVALYRHHDGEWVRLETRHRFAAGDYQVFTADSPGLSTFAVGYADADLAVTAASLADDRITAGEEAALDVTVTNDGDGAGELALEMAANGETVATETVSLGPAEDRSLTLAHAFDAPGEYDLTVNGYDAGTLVVESIATETPEPVTTAPPSEPTATATPDGSAELTVPGTEQPAADEPDDGNGTWLLIVLALLGAAAIVAAYVALRMQGEAKR